MPSGEGVLSVAFGEVASPSQSSREGNSASPTSAFKVLLSYWSDPASPASVFRSLMFYWLGSASPTSVFRSMLSYWLDPTSPASALSFSLVEASRNPESRGKHLGLVLEVALGHRAGWRTELERLMFCVHSVYPVQTFTPKAMLEITHSAG